MNRRGELGEGTALMIFIIMVLLFFANDHLASIEKAVEKEPQTITCYPPVDAVLGNATYNITIVNGTCIYQKINQLKVKP